jgi:hypothetical protein
MQKISKIIKAAAASSPIMMQAIKTTYLFWNLGMV